MDADEGKPTKAKWWSRPRPNEGRSAADDGDWHLPAPAPASGGGPDSLAAPPPVDDGTAAHAATPPPGEPTPTNSRPTGTAQGASGSGPGVDAGPADAVATGSFASPTQPTQPTQPAVIAAPGAATGVSGETAPGFPAEAAAPRNATVPGAVEGRADVDVARPVPGDGTRPPHDPDAYSTPPYGEPGPWAVAPPVQHPGATPAHGTATVPYEGGPGAQQPPYQGTPVPPPGGHSPVPVGPWQQYDPWAGPVSLSQSGAAVGAKPRRARRGPVLGAVLIALVSSGIGGAIGSYLERNGGTDVELPQAGAESTHRAPGSVAGIAASALPGVVTIHTQGSSEQGTGTGFVLDDRGHILTNNHVVEPAGTSGEISVTFAGGQSADAEVVGHDSGYDLAVIKVDGVRGLKPLPLGNSENVQVGDPVVAIGAPFDLANTVTSGIISAKERPITAGGEKGDGSDVSYVDALQTDAPINPGNSGGPLVDSKARVIGINSAIRSSGSGSELDGGQAGSIGLGFAIPINQAKRVAEELINTGKATHPVIGVTLDMDYTGDGARVGTKGNSGGSAVSPGGPGDRAGIEPRDVITEVDGTRVHSGEELIVKIRAHRPKDELVLTVERGGKEQKVTLVLGSADGN
ncbi:PDZ domain-containing protein [Streptomyces sp. SID8379]|uniref:S1C family serine protease n=1 Tax=unclassified Streptomyces TaxID=2593676 RepID=UPI000381AA7B|nr:MULTISPECIES: trypsin-like peptidase domain-containing protein [unclassified Streptomyces]MYW68954.1 PDZ domain-containing protein [Streptomyces sp. SID8379]